MRPCPVCNNQTEAHILINNNGVCNMCYDRQTKTRENSMMALYEEYAEIDRRHNPTPDAPVAQWKA